MDQASESNLIQARARWIIAQSLLNETTQPRTVELQGDGNCQICREPFLSGSSPELPLKLPCGHIYGQGCILKWFMPELGSAQNSCPSCRKPLLDGIFLCLNPVIVHSRGRYSRHSPEPPAEFLQDPIAELEGLRISSQASQVGEFAVENNATTQNILGNTANEQIYTSMIDPADQSDETRDFLRIPLAGGPSRPNENPDINQDTNLRLGMDLALAYDAISDSQHDPRESALMDTYYDYLEHGTTLWTQLCECLATRVESTQDYRTWISDSDLSTETFDLVTVDHFKEMRDGGNTRITERLAEVVPEQYNSLVAHLDKLPSQGMKFESASYRTYLQVADWHKRVQLESAHHRAQWGFSGDIWDDEDAENDWQTETDGEDEEI